MKKVKTKIAKRTKDGETLIETSGYEIEEGVALVKNEDKEWYAVDMATGLQISKSGNTRELATYNFEEQKKDYYAIKETDYYKEVAEIYKDQESLDKNRNER